MDEKKSNDLNEDVKKVGNEHHKSDRSHDLKQEKHKLKKQDETFTVSKVKLWQSGTFLFALLFVISLFNGGFGIGSGSTSGAAIVNPGTGNNNPGPPPEVSASADDDPFLGEEDAPVTLIEFSDYQCPFCSRFRVDTLDQIKSQYIDSGKVKFVYRDFPLTSIHPQAQPAAEAAQCAFDQNRDAYWDFHDALFENQASLGNDLYVRIATDLGLDLDVFNECVSSRKFQGEVNKDLQDAASAGGRGTPYFLICNVDGCIPLSGAQPFSSFQAAIEAQL